MRNILLEFLSNLRSLGRPAWLGLSLLCGYLFWIQPAFAQPAPLETRVEFLSVTEDEDDNEKVEEGKTGPEVYGFLQFFGMKAFDPHKERFRVLRVRVKIRGKVNKNIGYQVEIDPRAPEITGVMRDAYITMHYIKRHEIRLGQQKTQFGYENNVSSSRLYFVNRTDVSDDLSRGFNLRDMGVGLIGSVKLNKTWRVEDAVTVVNGQGANIQVDRNRTKNVWGRLGLRYKNNGSIVKIGASGAWGDLFSPRPDTTARHRDIVRFGTDLQLENSLFTFAGEYVIGWDDEKTVGDPDFGETTKEWGAYGLVTVKATEKMGPSARFEYLDGSKRFTAGGYYGMPDDSFRILLNHQFFDDQRTYLWLMVRF